MISLNRSLVAYLDEVPNENVSNIHIPNSVPFIYKIDPRTGKAVQQDSSPLSKSKGNWLLSAENQERLIDKLGVDSESFARSLFAAWDVDGDGYLSKQELANLLFSWKSDTNPAINALAGKILEEVCTFRCLNIEVSCLINIVALFICLAHAVILCKLILFL